VGVGWGGGVGGEIVIPMSEALRAADKKKQKYKIIERLMPSSSALIPMSICTLQCIFSHSFTTYK
jgi:hypothetical protein